MSLFRLAIIVAVGVSLLPSDRAQQEKLYKTAASAANWTMTFCDRNGPTCVKAASLWDDFTTKAQFGAQLAYDMAMEASVDADTGDDIRRVAPASLHSRGTLTPADLRPEWRGKSERRGSI